MTIHTDLDAAILAYRPEAHDYLFEVDRRKLRKFIGGYLEAAQFTDGDTDSECNGKDFPGDFGEGVLADMLADADKFLPLATKAVAQFLGFANLTLNDGEGYELDQLGRDFWFTRNGHGVGFWDRSFDGRHGTAIGEALTALVGHGTAFPQIDLYVGDDGLIYSA